MEGGCDRDGVSTCASIVKAEVNIQGGGKVLYETFNKSRTFPFLRAFINTLPEKVLKN
jgi:hypothetical protein